GATGTNGLNGATGATGTAGVQGPQGATGTNGLNGATGAAGVQGPQGATGANGLNGATGTAGVQGAQGVTGATGAIGTTGAAGPQGLQGIAGATGAQGVTGTTGATGPTWTLTVPTFNASGTFTVNGTTGSGGPVTSTGSAWLVGGNQLTTNPGIFGSLNNNHVDFRTNNLFRGRWLSTGELLIGSTTLIVPASAGDKFSAFITTNTNNWAINGVNTTASGGSIFASNNATTNGYNAIEGSHSGTGSAVFGLHIANTGNGTGVRGSTNSSAAGAYGVYAQMPTGSAGWALYVNGDAFTTSGVWFTSDRKLKTNIIPIESPLQKLLKLNGVSYNYKQDLVVKYGLSDRKNLGVIADDVEKIFPELIKNTQLTSKISGESKQNIVPEQMDAKTVNYIGFIPVLIEAIKEQQAQIEILTKKIEELERR
ncbi:MAG: tail fiber domain-containing protein, partial [Bacteroidota bacterium]|nr:tail fiber domain-containing protein [Bacteroidota bacterium]